MICSITKEDNLRLQKDCAKWDDACGEKAFNFSVSSQIFHSMTYIKIFIMLHFLLSFRHNYAITVSKKGAKYYATYYAY